MLTEEETRVDRPLLRIVRLARPLGAAPAARRSGHGDRPLPRRIITAM